MRVLVTGGTGFVGAHTVRALTDRGHDVRLLVRDKARIAPALRPVGVDPDTVEAVVAPVTDTDAMATAMDGCDAAVHAAAVYSWDPPDAEEMERLNVAAADAVLGAGVRAGADPVVHVSSVVAIARKGGGTLDGTAEVGDIDGSYPRSKQASDVVARALQASGAPVVRVSPGGMLGPHDPHLGETDRTIRDILRGLYPMWIAGGMPYGDVRDTAATLAAVVDRGPGHGPSAWIPPSTNVEAPELFARLRALTGRRLPVAFLPGSMMLPVMKAARVPMRLLPERVTLPFPTEGGSDLFAARNTADDSATLATFGLARRDLDDTLRDTVRWLVDAGHLSAKRAGRALR